MIGYMNDIMLILALWLLLGVATLGWFSFIQNSYPYLLPSWAGPKVLMLLFSCLIING
jgi:hypothetical protein